MSIKLRQNIYDSFQFTYIILCLIILILIFINSIYNTTVVFSKSYDKILKDIKKNISVSSLKDYKILCNYYIDDNFKYNDILLSMNVYNDIFTSYSYFTIAYVIFIIVIYFINLTSKDKNENDFLFFNINYYNFLIEDTNTNTNTNTNTYTNYMKLLLVPIICLILFIVYMGLYGAIINEKKIYDYRLAYGTTESIEQLIFNDYKTKMFDSSDNKTYYILLNHILNNNNKYNFIDLCPTADIKSDINENVKYFIDKMAKANGITIDKKEVLKYNFLQNILHMCAILCKINENTNVDVVKTFRDFFKKCEYYRTNINNIPVQSQTYGNKIVSDIDLTFYELISKNINSFAKIFRDIKDNTYAEEKDIYSSKVIFLHSLLTKYYLDNDIDSNDNIIKLISSDNNNNSYARKLLGKNKTTDNEKGFFKNKIKFFKGITSGMIMTNLVITSILFLIIFGFFQDKFKKILDIFKYTYTINYLLTLLIKNSHKYTIIIPILISILNFINNYFHIVIPVIILMLIILFIILISTLT